MSFTEKITSFLKSLEEEKVEYVLIGGIAVILHGVLRFTADIDIIINFEKENVKKFLKILKKFNLKPRVPINPEDLMFEEKREEWIKGKGAKVINFVDSSGFPFPLQVDVSLTEKYDEIERERKKINDFEVWVISKSNLIKLKEKAGRPIDLNDIEKLKEIENA